ncbi:hypothetical protein DSO57_1009179 [Entomophthora muscae]|uniref:Uncharacterized protein n=1 Tax=Entomophthora muscae TaxID=34485 RepID=A0ACC2T6Z0_9FUNG|nr:hypothetical protein DSO57_1009179 [Entomophthora muscae]
MDLPTFIWNEVFGYLDHRSRCKVRLVNKQWNGVLVPLVFSLISKKFCKAPEKLDGIVKKYSKYVRTLEVIKIDSCLYQILSCCTCVIHVSFEYSDTESLQYLLELGERLPQLRHFSMHHVPLSAYRQLENITSRVYSLDIGAEDKKADNLRENIKSLRCPLVRRLKFMCDSSIWDKKFFLLLLLAKYPTLEQIEHEGGSLSANISSFIYDVINCQFLNVGFLNEAYVYLEMFYLKDAKKLIQNDQRAHELQADKVFNIDFDKKYPILATKFKHVKFAKLTIFSFHQDNTEKLFASLTGISKLEFNLNFGFGFDSYNLPNILFQAQSVSLMVSGSQEIWLWLAKCFPNLTYLYINDPFDFPCHESRPCILKSLKTISSSEKIATSSWQNIIESSPNLSQVFLAKSFQIAKLAKKYPTIFFSKFLPINFNYFDSLKQYYADTGSDEE